MLNRILVIDDDKWIYESVKRSLMSDFDCIHCTTIQEARTLLDHSIVDLILLDIKLPDGDGFSFCAQLQSNPRTERIPTIILSSAGEEIDIVHGFQLGADDYLVKPFQAGELKARVQARIRKFAKASELERRYRIAGMCIDLDSQKVFWEENGDTKEIELTRTEFKILNLLANAPGRIFSRDQIIEAIWTDKVNVTDRNIDTRVSSLRKKLGKFGHHLQSKYGEGYRFSK